MPQRAPFLVSYIRLTFNLSTPLQKVVLSLGKVLWTLSQKILIPDPFLTAILLSSNQLLLHWNAVLSGAKTSD